MPVIFRGPTFLQVTIDGQHVTTGNSKGVLSARVSLGYDLQSAEAEVEVPQVPSWANTWSKVQIEMGASQATSQTRFVGYLVQIERELYPQTAKLVCRGYLVKAVLEEQGATGGVDYSNNGAGRTDQAIISSVLDNCGLTTSVVSRNIQGTSAIIGAVAQDQCRWQSGETALAFIQRLDQICLGYRTFDGIGGTIIRQKITSNPSGAATLTFTEGVDIFRANTVDTILDAKNRIVVSGYNDGENTRSITVEQQSTFVPNNNFVTATLQNPLIERSNTSDAGTGIACEDVAKWLLGELNRRIYKVNLTTPRDDLIAPGATIAISSPNRLGFNQNFWVQHVEPSVSQAGEFSQQLTCIAGQGGTAPIIESPIADFAMRVTEAEQVLTGNTQGVLYTVNCTDTSVARSNPIVSYAWSASSGGLPASSTGSAFTVGFSDITNAQLTLTVTDSAGLSDTLTKDVPDAVINTYVQRKLYTAGPGYLEDFDGATWRTVANTSTFAVTDGAYWASGSSVLHATDDLKSAPVATTPFGGSVNVTSVECTAWYEPNFVTAGSSTGQVAYSTNSGGTWTLMTSPSSDPVEDLGISYPNHNTQWVLTTKRLYQTTNLGSTWTVLQSAAAGETFRCLIVSSSRWMIAMAGGRLMIDANSGVQQTFPSLTPAVSDIYAVCPGMGFIDRFLALDSYGRVFLTSADHGTALVQTAQPLPSTCQPQIRGLAADGSIYGLYYFAGGTDGVWKSLDTFATTGGMLRLRQPGVAGAPSDATYSRVKPDGRYSAPANDGLRVLVTGTYGGSPMAYYTQNITASPVTWVPVSTVGLPPSGTLSTPRLNPQQTHQAYALVDQKAVYTNPEVFLGGTWSPVILSAQVTDLVNAGFDEVDITDFAVTPTGSNLYVVATTKDTYLGVPMARHRFWLLMTTNGGSTWQVTEFATGISAVDSVNWSTDNGYCGASISTGQHVAGVLYLVVAKNNGTATGGGGFQAFYSTNSGATITFATFVDNTWGMRHQVVCPTDTNANDQEAMLFIANDFTSTWAAANGAFHTTNGGVNWSTNYTTNIHPGPVLVDSLNSSNWYYYPDFTTDVYQSTNRAQTFTKVGSVAPKMARSYDWTLKHLNAGGVRHYAVGQSSQGKFSRVLISTDLSAWTACDGNLPGDGYNDGLLYGVVVDPNS